MTTCERSLPPTQESSISFTNLGALLDDVCFQNGIYKHSDAYGTGAPILRITDFDNHGRLTTSSFSRVALSPREHSQYAIRENDILINRVNSLSHIGKSMLVPSMHEYPVFESNMMRIRISNESPLTPEYVAAVLQAEPARKHFRKVAKPAVAQASINQGDVRTVAIALHPKPVQMGIAKALFAWDLALEKTEKLIAAKERYLRHLRARLLRDPDGSSPTKLRTVTRELTGRNGNALGRDAIMAVTKQVGMRPMREETIAASIERYKRVPPSAFAYNPMRLNIGSIAMSPFDSDVLVSPDYVVFACDESRLLPGYLHHLRFSQSWKNHFELAGNGSVRVRIYYGDLGTFSFALPPIATQTRIVKFLDTAAREIALLKDQAGTLRDQKRGLMQKLLTGQWRLPTAKRLETTDDHS